MTKPLLILALALSVSGCTTIATSQAQGNYVRANGALNACLLQNPGKPHLCDAQQAVVSNDLALYTNLINE
jgi:hypothetical protein